MELDNFVVNAFVFSLCTALIILLLKRFASPNQIHPDFKAFLVKAFVISTSLTLTATLQMPYRYQHFLENGLSHAKVSEIMSYHHLVIAAWSILLPVVLKKVGHRAMMVVSTVLFALSSVLCGMFGGSVNALTASMCITGIAMPSINRCLQDIWQREEKNMPEEWNANYVFNEVDSFVSLIVMWVASPLSSAIVARFGTSSIFNFTPTIALAAVVPVILFVKTYEMKEKDGQKEISDMGLIRRTFTSNKLTYIVLLMDIATSIALFMMKFRLSAFMMTKEHKPPMGIILGTFGVLELIGAQAISYFSHYANYLVWVGGILVAIGFVTVQVFVSYQNKITVFIYLCLYSLFISMFNANIFYIRKRFYPTNVKMYFLSMVRVPTSLITFLILSFYHTEKIQYFALISGGLFFASSLMCLIVIYFVSKEHEVGDEDELLSDINQQSEGVKEEDNEEEEIKSDEDVKL